LTIPLLIGISFYTFERRNLLVDVFKENKGFAIKLVSKTFSEHVYHTLFIISFFPHVVAVPILKAYDLFEMPVNPCFVKLLF
jgi:alginate O-acetyltransferase complex protein AlgI